MSPIAIWTVFVGWWALAEFVRAAINNQHIEASPEANTAKVPGEAADALGQGVVRTR